MDNLGDDFSVPADTGVIEPLTEFALQMDFKAIKATNIKKVVRLEVFSLLCFNHSVLQKWCNPTMIENLNVTLRFESM